MELREYTKLSKEVLLSRIEDARRKKKVVILAHNYQRSEIQRIADFRGDSLDLARKATEVDAEIIVFCGVVFMAETAKILNPQKKVLIPDLNAGCALADTITAEELKEAKRRYDNPVVVSYINTYASVKAESDLCCTSANAVKVIDSIPKDKKILFTPDRNLGRYVSKVSNRELILWDGFCYVHDYLTEGDVEEAKREHPFAKLCCHPECKEEVVAHADLVTSTNGMVRYAKEVDELIIGTEIGLGERINIDFGKKVYPLNTNAVCATMKFITLDKLCWSIENEKYEIRLDDDIISKAKEPLEKMLQIV